MISLRTFGMSGLINANVVGQVYLVLRCSNTLFIYRISLEVLPVQANMMKAIKALLRVSKIIFARSTLTLKFDNFLNDILAELPNLCYIWIFSSPVRVISIFFIVVTSISVKVTINASTITR